MTQLGLVCLTTTPTRLPKIGPVLRSLCKHAEVALFVPQTFLRTGEKYPEDECAKLSEIENLHIVRTPEDYGPATKVAGCLHLPDDLKSKYKRIVYVDDDILYDVERLRALTVPPFDSIKISGRVSGVENIVYGFSGLKITTRTEGIRANGAPVIPDVIEGFKGVSVPSGLVTSGDLVDFVQNTRGIGDFSCSDDLILSYFFTHEKKKDLILLPEMGKQVNLKYGFQNDALHTQDLGHVKRYPGLWEKLMANTDLMDNVVTFHTPHGNVTLYKNERYIINDFKRGSYFDIDTLSKLKPHVDPTRNILEIGGHCGTSSIVYSSFLTQGKRVFVFEPQKNMYELLLKNINQNNLQDKIIPHNAGVFCYEGTGQMNDVDLDGGMGLVSKRYHEEKNLPCNFGGIGLGGKGEVINLVTVDNMVDNMKLDNIGFIHCDAQGAENFIFSRAIETIKKFRPVIYFENNQVYGKYLYDNVCKNHPSYKEESLFDVKRYCMETLKYSRFIDRFNGSIDTLLIP